MPRPKREDGVEPKKRSRTGCWPCKARKVKCGEEKPVCANCAKSGETCDYSIRLNWGGRSRKDKDATPGEAGSFTFVATPTSVRSPASNKSSAHDHVFPAQHIATAPARPPSSHPANPPTPEPTPGNDGSALDPRLRLGHQGPPSRPDEHSVGLPSAGWPAFSSAQHSPAPTDRTSPTSVPATDEFSWSPQHRAKRVKLNSSPATQASPVFAVPQYPSQSDLSPLPAHYTPHGISTIVNTPATPGSSANSGSPYPPNHANLHVHDPPDLRRLSVKSLLSDPSQESERPHFTRIESHGHRTYGYDHGFADLDVPHNDDFNVVLPKSPDLRRPSAAVSEISTSSGEVDAKQIAFEPGGYYAQPVPIKIPRALEPLPPELLENQMNLLYFHHFINHTGRILVPHDCPENPFRGVLPQMAVRNIHLLRLLLAWSASHRARLLDHPEPANRIAQWMTDVLPALRQALNEPSSPGTTDPGDPSSLAPLATAITLASLEIVTPDTFSVRIPWQQHLQVARNMIVQKGGLDYLARKADGARDKAIFFLSRWFAYLDVLGSLSNRHEQPLFGAYLEDGGGLWLVNRDNEEIYQIDCFFGFSGRCIALLAQVAELTAQCDNQRIDPVTNQVKAGWRPSEEVRHQAEELKKRLTASAGTVFRGCMHTDPTSSQFNNEIRDEKDTEEIYATNEAYHWAGLIHLARRVLALPSTHPEVQDSVQMVLSSLQKVRRGSSAESCLLFPMFTAGCEAQKEEQRALFMDRLRAVEGWGMQHVGRARALMQTVWDTGKPWETLVDGEFFG
ncbi:Serine threonine kinase [Lecanosticta acicola]|uniref:Serine threonine kinase, partial n=1 Tax=Lecanosticta acicola TaxID=111012 RepID=A0AAI8YYK3_9PEZI|nr:Serine threonine kinase [Lecanosticta acicola]